MSFVVMDPDPLKRVELAIEDIRAGRMVILVDDEDRENEGDLTLAADAVTPEAINFMATHGRGLICLTLSEERVAQLELPMMAANNQSPYHTAFTVSIEAREGVSTGISAADRAHTVRVAIDPTKSHGDIVTPGHIFPLKARDGGVLVRTGQTEGSVDIARLAGLKPAGVICEIMNEDGTMSRLPDLRIFGQKHRIRIVAIADLIQWRIRTETLVEPVIDMPLQIDGIGTFRARVFRSLTEGSLHLALSMGDLEGDTPVLTRMQASAPVSDVFGGDGSGSGARLDASLRAIADEGRGLLLYLYLGGSTSADALLSRLQSQLQPSQGKATAAPAADLREMGIGAQVLVCLGVRELRLMTNNPRKIVGLEGYGLRIAERVPLSVPSASAGDAALRRRLQLDALGAGLPTA